MRRDGRWGMTLIELLVVVAIIGVLVSVMLPAVQAARETARRTQCHSNLRQLGLAAVLHAERDGAFPIGCMGFFRDSAVTPPPPQRLISWNVRLLPFLEEVALWQEFHFAVPSYHASNKAVAKTILPVFLCPSTAEEALINWTGLWKGCAFTDYGGLYGVEGVGRNRDPNESTPSQPAQTLREDSLGVMLYDEPVQPKQVSDGLSKTASIAEMLDRRQTECEWVNGHNIFAQEEATPINLASGLSNDIGSPHPGGASLVFCDGHVEFVAETIEQAVLNAMLTKAGGER